MKRTETKKDQIATAVKLVKTKEDQARDIFNLLKGKLERIEAESTEAQQRLMANINAHGLTTALEGGSRAIEKEYLLRLIIPLLDVARRESEGHDSLSSGVKLRRSLVSLGAAIAARFRWAHSQTRMGYSSDPLAQAITQKRFQVLVDFCFSDCDGLISMREAVAEAIELLKDDVEA